MKDFNSSSFLVENSKKEEKSYNTIKEKEPKAKKAMFKKSLYANLAEEDLEKYRQIISDPEALVSIDDPLGINRNLCMLCKLDCKSYKPAHSYIFNNKNIFPSYCINCGCGASNHLPTEFEYKMIPREIVNVLYNNNVTNEHINFDGILTVFSIEEASNIEISNFMKLLKEAGFNIIATKIDTLLDKEGDILTDNIEKYYNDLINGKSEFSKLVLKDTCLKTLNLDKRKDKNFVAPTKTMTVPKKRINNIEYLDHFISPVLSVCLQTKPKRGHSTIKYLEEIYYSTRKLFTKKLNLIYYSKTKINALWDLQIMFPEIFRVNSYISIVTEKNNFFHEIKKNNTVKEIYEYNKFFMRTKTIKNEKMKEGEEEERKKIDEVQKMKESKYKAEKIKNSYLPNSQISNLSENLQSTLSPIPVLTSNVFFKYTNKEEDKKPNEKEKNLPMNRKKTLKFFDVSQIDLTATYSDEESDQSQDEDSRGKDEFMNLKNKLIDSDKPDKFEVKNKTSREREIRFYKNLSEFKDYLSLNSCVLNEEVIFNSKAQIIEIWKQYKDNTFIKNFCDYILSNSEFEKKCKYTDILLLSKVGPNLSVNPSSIFENIDIVNISKPREYEILSNLFFENIVSYNRVMIVFRPIMVRCGLNDVLINVFKINGFHILKRKFMRLNNIDAKFLFSLEGLDPNFLDDYIKIMIESEVEVVCLSRYGAIQISKILCDGALDGNLNFNYSILDKIDLKVEYEVRNDLIHDDDKIKKAKYESFVDLNTASSENHLLFENVFTAISELIDIDYLLDLVVENDILKLNLLLKDDKSRKEMYGQIQQYELFTKINEIRSNLLRFCRMFNICMYSTKEPKLLEKELNYFHKDLCSMHEVIIIVKPVSQNISNLIKLTLERMKFEVIRSVSYKIKEPAFDFLFERCLPSLGEDLYQKVRLDFILNEVEVIRMVKPGGNVEIEAVIGKNNEHEYLTINDIDNIPNDYNKLLKTYCFHLNISKDYEFMYDVVDPKLAVIEGSFLLNNKNLIHDIINSCLKCTIGESIRQDENIQEKLLQRYLKFYHHEDNSKINQYFSEVLNNYMISTWKISSNIIEKHYNKFFEFLLFKNDLFNHQLGFLVESSNLGFYEVRIPIFKHSVSSLIDLEIDMVQINIARNYPFYDKGFYDNLEKIYQNNKIVCEVHEFFDLFFYDSQQLVKDANDYNSKFANKLKQFDLILTNKGLVDAKTGFTEAYSIISNKHILNDERLNEIQDEVSKSEMKNLVLDTLKSIKARVYYKTKYESNLFFYKLACKNELNCTPNNYHFRIKPDDIHCKIRRIYEVEEFSGLYFIDVVSQDYMKYRLPEKDSNSYRFSMSGFLWGKRLSELCKSFEKMKSEEIENCGPLIYSKDSKLKGIINPKFFIEYETFLYLNIIKDLKETMNRNLLDNQFISVEDFEKLNKKVLLVLNSKAFKISRKEENLVLVPTRLLDFNLRVSKKHDINSVIKHEKERGINSLDPNHEMDFHQFFKENERMDLKDMAVKNLVLVDILWNKHSKYKMYGMIEWLMKIKYMKINRKSYLLNNNEDDYDNMIEAVLTGFYNFMIIDKHNDNDDINIYRVEYFLVGLLELKYLLNDLCLFRNYLTLIQNSKKHFIEKQKKGVSKENMEILNDLEQIIKMLESTLNLINMDLEIIFFELLDCEIKHIPESSHLSKEKYIFLPKERYHIPMHMNDKKFEEADIERYTVIEKIDQVPYKIDLNTLKKYESRVGNQPITFDDPIIRKKIMLRDIPDKKENFIKIIKGNFIKKRTMKLFMFWMRKQINSYLLRTQISKTWVKRSTGIK